MNITKKDIIEYIEKYGTIFDYENSYWDLFDAKHRLSHSAGSEYEFDKHFNAKTKENCTLTPVTLTVEEVTHEDGALIEGHDRDYIKYTNQHPTVQITGYECACGEYKTLGIYVDMNLDNLVTDILAEKLGIERRYADF